MRAGPVATYPQRPAAMQGGRCDNDAEIGWERLLILGGMLTAAHADTWVIKRYAAPERP